jgi:hypothetical protein
MHGFQRSGLMSEQPAPPYDSRSARISAVEPDHRSEDRRCGNCGASLEGHRSDADHCSDACRKAAWRDRAHEGKLVAKRQLKSGEWSLIVRLPADVGLVPGQTVRVGDV